MRYIASSPSPDEGAGVTRKALPVADSLLRQRSLAVFARGVQLNSVKLCQLLGRRCSTYSTFVASIWVCTNQLMGLGYVATFWLPGDTNQT